MTTINSVFATNVGALVLNLASRGLFVKLGVEDQILGGQVLILVVSDAKGKSLKQYISEAEVVAIQDIVIIADAIVERLRKSGK